MPYYVKIESQNSDIVTKDCGTAKIADRLANSNGNVAGDDFSWVNAFELDIEQPHNEHGGGTVSPAPALHTITITTPDYEPILVATVNVLARQDLIKKVTFNIAAIKQGNNDLLAQYIFENGMITDYQHIIDDQRDPNAQKQRGHVVMTFKFQKITVNNKVSNNSGVLTTTAS